MLGSKKARRPYDQHKVIRLGIHAVNKEETDTERERVVCKKKMKDVMIDKEWKQNNPMKEKEREYY